MSGEPTAAPSPAPAGTPSTASPQAHWKRRPRRVAMPQQEAVRQGAISKLAFLLLGREAAITFLNSEHDGLGGQPLALATASAAGCDDVQAELARMVHRAPDD